MQSASFIELASALGPLGWRSHAPPPKHRTPIQNGGHCRGCSTERHPECARPVTRFSVGPDGRAPVVTRLPVDMERLRAGDEFIRGPYRSVVR